MDTVPAESHDWLLKSCLFHEQVDLIALFLRQGYLLLTGGCPRGTHRVNVDQEPCIQVYIRIRCGRRHVIHEPVTLLPGVAFIPDAVQGYVDIAVVIDMRSP